MIAPNELRDRFPGVGDDTPFASGNSIVSAIVPSERLRFTAGK